MREGFVLYIFVIFLDFLGSKRGEFWWSGGGGGYNIYILLVEFFEMRMSYNFLGDFIVGVLFFLISVGIVLSYLWSFKEDILYWKYYLYL